MSLEHAILGFLNYQPLTGYELKKIFDNSVRHFWPADQAQIYRTLARLEQNGLTTIEVVQQEDRPDRKLYHITPAGRVELAGWLSKPQPIEDSRSAALIQVFFAGQLSNDQVIEIFENAAGKMRAMLSHYAEVPAIVQPYKEMVGSEREIFFWMLTLDSGIHMAKAQLQWLEGILAKLRSGQAPEK